MDQPDHATDRWRPRLSVIPPELKDRLRLAVAFFGPWAVLWFGSHWISSLWPWRLCLAVPGEEQIPFVAAMVPWYLSLDLAVPLVWLLAPDLATVRRIYRTLLVQTAVAATVFMLLPQKLAFPNHTKGAIWEGIAQSTSSPNLSWHANAPSLHVAFAFTLAAMLFPTWGKSPHAAWRLLGWGWATGVAVSTWLVHEHHIVDIISGLGLAWWGCRELRLQNSAGDAWQKLPGHHSPDPPQTTKIPHNTGPAI